MAEDYAYSSWQLYNFNGSRGVSSNVDGVIGGTATDDGFWNPDDRLTDTDGWAYQGHYIANGHLFLVYAQTGSHLIYSTSASTSDAGYPSSFANVPSLNTDPLAVCFAAGTMISTPEGETKVECLAIGDQIRTPDGRSVPVIWIGRQTIHRLFAKDRVRLVQIRAGALGNGKPHSDLIVTGDHGMIVDGLVINASALVNGASIDWVPLSETPERFTVYHIETEAHDVILANGAASETFIDYPGRQAFDNYAEYVEMYGAERIIREMPQPRISSPRMLPDVLKARLGRVAVDHPAKAG